MTSRKEFSPKDLAEQFRELKALRIQVAEAELSQKMFMQTKHSGTDAEQPSREPSTKQL